MMATKERIRMWMALLPLACLLIAQQLGCASAPQDPNALPATRMQIGREKFTLEIARRPAQRERGLMFRKSMPADHGMIFTFPDEEERSFWMKNTEIPLDILFLRADGTVVSVHQMRPFALTGVPSNGPAKYAIELNEGTAARVGVKAGDRLQIPADAAQTKE